MGSAPDYEKLWYLLRHRLMSSGSACMSAARVMSDEQACERAILTGFAFALTSVERAMADGVQFGSVPALGTADLLAALRRPDGGAR